MAILFDLSIKFVGTLPGIRGRFFQHIKLDVGTVCVNDTHHVTNFQPIIVHHLQRVANHCSYLWVTVGSDGHRGRKSWRVDPEFPASGTPSWGRSDCHSEGSWWSFEAEDAAGSIRRSGTSCSRDFILYGGSPGGVSALGLQNCPKNGRGRGHVTSLHFRK